MFRMRSILAILAAISLGAAYVGSAQQLRLPDHGTDSDDADRASQPRRLPAATDKDRIHSDVYKHLDRAQDGKVYVMIELKETLRTRSEATRVHAISQLENEFLSQFSPRLTAEYELTDYPIIFAYVNIATLEKLNADSSVQSVQYKVDPIIHERLSDGSNDWQYVMVELSRSEEDDEKLEKLLDAVERSEDETQVNARLDLATTLVNDIREPLLAAFATEELKVVSSSRPSNVFVAKIKRSALDKLIAHPHVRRIGFYSDDVSYP